MNMNGNEFEKAMCNRATSLTSRPGNISPEPDERVNRRLLTMTGTVSPSPGAEKQKVRIADGCPLLSINRHGLPLSPWVTTN
jgi:hypothetical protein